MILELLKDYLDEHTKYNITAHKLVKLGIETKTIICLQLTGNFRNIIIEYNGNTISITKVINDKSLNYYSTTLSKIDINEQTAFEQTTRILIKYLSS